MTLARAVALVLACLTHAAHAAAPIEWPGEQGKWLDRTQYKFEVDGRPAWIAVPEHPAPGNPWVWRARFPGFHAEADRLLLDRGFHIAYLNTDGMLGSPRAMKHWDAFYRFCTERGLARRVALEGVSRGGLFVYGFASRWPDRVACIYADTPVCDFKSWPGGKGHGLGHAPTWNGLLKEYAFADEDAALAYTGNPIDTLAPLAKADIPLLHIVSLNDKVVPPDENTFVLAERYRKLGGTIDIIEVKEGTAKSNGHHFTHPDPVRVADFIERWSGTLQRAAPSTPKHTHEHFVMRGSLDNARLKFERDKVGKVVFMGGSITNMGNGWREVTMDYLRQRFPQTEFTFVNAGIPSTGSVPGAFRLMRDAFGGGDAPPDLLFEEAAVNDLHNMRSNVQMTRGMEGILRHARRANPNLDIVVMHFVDPNHMDDYRAGKTPNTIAHHEPVAEYYGVPTIHLAREVTERIDAGQFTWADDFKNLHPSPYGHRLYAATIRRLLATAWADPLPPDARIKPHALPAEPMDKFSYDRAAVASIDEIKAVSGFAVIAKCDPRAGGVGGGVRDGFVNVDMLVGTEPGATIEKHFRGRAIALFVAAGPDAGVIEYRIDDGEWQTQDLFTKWSASLHLPWVYVLADELDGGKPHTLTVRIADTKNEASKGHACRIVHLLVNE